MGETFVFTQRDDGKLDVHGWGDRHYADFETLAATRSCATRPAGGWRNSRRKASALEPVLHAGGRYAMALVARSLRAAPEKARAAGRAGALRFGGRRCDERRTEDRQERRKLRAIAEDGGPARAPPQRSIVGDYIALTLPVDFADAPATIGREEVERFSASANQVDYSRFDNNGSVHDYFLENSLGRCRYTNIVAPCYRARFPKTCYTDSTIPMGQRAQRRRAPDTAPACTCSSGERAQIMLLSARAPEQGYRRRGRPDPEQGIQRSAKRIGANHRVGSAGRTVGRQAPGSGRARLPSAEVRHRCTTGCPSASAHTPRSASSHC